MKSKKSTTRKRTTRSVATATKTKPETTREKTAKLGIPPLVVALAQFVDQDMCGRLYHDFERAWREAPGMASEIAAGRRHVLGSRGPEEVTRSMVDDAITESRNSDWTGGQRAGVAMSALGRDVVDEVISMVATPAFYTGYALGLYLLTQGAQQGVPVRSVGVGDQLESEPMSGTVQ